MYYIIYEVTNTINGKKYIGKHQTNNLNDSYMGSGILILQAIKKYGVKNFIKRILFVFDNKEDMNKKEIELITEEIVNSDNYYNIGLGGQGSPMFKGRNHTEITKNKLSEIAKNISEESRERIKSKAINRKHSKETIEKIRLAAQNRRHSEETKMKISNSVKGFKHSADTKEKISRARKKKIP